MRGLTPAVGPVRYPSGESYMDVIQRLEPVVIEIERERECVCVVAHQAILRAIYGYFTKTPLKARRTHGPSLSTPGTTVLVQNLQIASSRAADLGWCTYRATLRKNVAVTHMTSPFVRSMPAAVTTMCNRSGHSAA